MKYCVILVGGICSFCFFSLQAQVKTTQRSLGYTFEEVRKDARASGDSFLQRGDTLYLLYDRSDSLQEKMGKSVRWWQRPLMENEKTLDIRYFDFGGVKTYFSKQWKLNGEKMLSLGEMEKLILTTREELVVFYERELKRMEVRKAKDKDFKIYVQVWGFWNLKWYFDKIYMIEVKENGIYIMHEV